MDRVAVTLTHADEVAILQREGYRVWRCTDWVDALDGRDGAVGIIRWMIDYGWLENDTLVAGPSDLRFARIDDFAGVYHDDPGDALDQFSIDPPTSARELLELRACAASNLSRRISA